MKIELLLIIFIIGISGCVKYDYEWEINKYINISSPIILNESVCNSDYMNIKLDFITHEVDRSEICGWLISNIESGHTGWIIGVDRPHLINNTDKTDYNHSELYIAIADGDKFNYLFSKQIQLNTHYYAEFELNKTSLKLCVDGYCLNKTIDKPMKCKDDMRNIILGQHPDQENSNHWIDAYIGKIKINTSDKNDS